MSDVVEELVIEVRDHYVAQFRAFIRRQQATCKTGGPEVKFELGGDTTAFHRIAVVDFVRNDGAPEGILFEPENILTFEKIEGVVANTKLEIDGLRWDSIVIDHDAPHIMAAIEAWFRKWFDPDELRLDPAAELSGCIHAVYVEPNALQVDLGTASAPAFWELLDSVAHGGATFLHVRS